MGDQSVLVEPQIIENVVLWVGLCHWMCLAQAWSRGYSPVWQVRPGFWRVCEMYKSTGWPSLVYNLQSAW